MTPPMGAQPVLRQSVTSSAPCSPDSPGCRSCLAASYWGHDKDPGADAGRKVDSSDAVRVFRARSRVGRRLGRTACRGGRTGSFLVGPGPKGLPDVCRTGGRCAPPLGGLGSTVAPAWAGQRRVSADADQTGRFRRGAAVHRQSALTGASSVAPSQPVHRTEQSSAAGGADLRRLKGWQGRTGLLAMCRCWFKATSARQETFGSKGGLTCQSA